MASKKRLTLLQQQQAKLKKQRALAKTPRARSLIDQRINRVQVQIVETTKALKGSLPPKSLPAKSSATPPASDGGLPRNLRKYLPQGTSGGSGGSSRREQATAKQQKAAEGTRGSTTQYGSQSPASIRNELRAVRRAQAEIGRNRGGPLSAAAGALIEKALTPLARTAGHALGSNARRLLGGGEPTKDKNGNPIFNNTAAINAKLKKEKAEKAARDRKQAQYLADKAAAKAAADKKAAAARAEADKKAAAAKAEADRKALLAKQNSNAPTSSSAAQSLRAGRSPDRSPSKPGKKTYGSTGRKDLKQSSRMASALKNLKVRNYKKKK